MSILIDSYNPTTDFYNTVKFGNTTTTGQSFSCNVDTLLNSCVFQISKVGSPTGNITAVLYAHTGVYGTSSKPTGTVLATSDPIDISTISTTKTNVTFTFSGVNKYPLTTNKYVILLKYSGTTSLNIWYLTGNGASGNSSYNTAPTTWASLSGFDYLFFVYGDDIPISNGNFLQFF